MIKSLIIKEYTPLNADSTNCSNGVQWIYTSLQDCVVDSRGVASVICGLLSMIIWMAVGFPQMVKNCRNSQAVEAISVFLLLFWLLGDSTNLIGCFLTGQLPLQIYIAIYYVCSDFVLIIQFIYFKYKRRLRQKRVNYGSSFEAPQAILCFSGGMLVMGGMNMLVKMLTSGHLYSPIARHPAGRTLLNLKDGHIPLFKSKGDLTGYVIGCMSGILYVSSRLGQICSNYQRKSTEGLSWIMFFMAILGNLFYGLEILIRSLDEIFLIRHIPWIIGSLGVLFLDASIVMQFYLYRNTDFNTLSRAPLLAPESINEDGEID